MGAGANQGKKYFGASLDPRFSVKSKEVVAKRNRKRD